MTSRRQRARAARRAELHRAMLARATTPAARAAVEYDILRTAIWELPESQRDAAWAELTRLHSDFRVKLADTASPQVTGEVHNFTSQRGRGVSRIPRPAPRARARARGTA
jgi:hypothetical protein